VVILLAMMKLRASQERFVPRHTRMSEQNLLRLKSFLRKSRRLLVVTGAGVSTESGIQDYRSVEVGLYSTTTHRPTRIAEFLRSPIARQRYWARNAVAWPLFRAFSPNVSHHFLATLEQKGRLHWLVTQNVDRLHHKAGATRVTELHGTMFTVTCLSCLHSQSRDQLQTHITAQNPGWNPTPEGFAPDADVFVSDDAVRNFCAPVCQKCGGDLKPDVVFFGDSVLRPTVEFVNHRLAEADACLVVGTSLQTYSAFRHVRQAHELQLPMLIMNIGPTRADGLEDFRLTVRCGEAFQKLFNSVDHW
jgi:NAD-dependent deacetylase sirtuin 4